jgi:hypothetical protein
MLGSLDPQTVDLIVVAMANLVNLLLMGMFLARTRQRWGAARGLGTAATVLGIPVLLAAVWNALEGRPWWLIVLPLPYVAFCAVEWLADYVLDLPVRTSPMLGPYLALFYLGLLGLMGYCFAVSAALGFSTLATYLACLGATSYSYSKVGHGVPHAH